LLITEALHSSTEIRVFRSFANKTQKRMAIASLRGGGGGLARHRRGTGAAGFNPRGRPGAGPWVAPLVAQGC
jgi:hypothetical protein